jgi:hypothetical protein
MKHSLYSYYHEKEPCGRICGLPEIGIPLGGTILKGSENGSVLKKELNILEKYCFQTNIIR